MAVRKFRSKIDGWVVMIFVATVVLLSGSLGAASYNSPHAATAAALIVGMLVFIAFLASVFVATYYTIDGNTLTVVFGPMRWRVPIDEITALEPTRSPISSPALSLDRLRIRYSGKKSIMISPVDKKRFIEALRLGEVVN